MIINDKVWPQFQSWPLSPNPLVKCPKQTSLCKLSISFLLLCFCNRLHRRQFVQRNKQCRGSKCLLVFSGQYLISAFIFFQGSAYGLLGASILYHFLHLYHVALSLTFAPVKGMWPEALNLRLKSHHTFPLASSISIVSTRTCPGQFAGPKRRMRQWGRGAKPQKPEAEMF
jgi:hypothetical protein